MKGLGDNRPTPLRHAHARREACPICGSATLTTVASRLAIPLAAMVAKSAKPPPLLLGPTCQSSTDRSASPPLMASLRLVAAGTLSRQPAAPSDRRVRGRSDLSDYLCD
jgi:hypothetical protein